MPVRLIIVVGMFGPRALVLATVGLLIGGCTTGAHNPANSPAGLQAGHTWRLDGGLFVAAPAPDGLTSPHGRAQAIRAARSADFQFISKEALMGTSSTKAVGLGAAHVLVSFAPTVKIACAQGCASFAPLPTAREYQRRPAWIVWYRLISSGPISCPPISAARRAPASIAAHAGWTVFVYPDRLDNAVVYHESRRGACGELSPASVGVAEQHIGLAWHVITRHDRTVTIGFTPPRCGRSAFSEAGSDSLTQGSISIVFATPFGTHNCPTPHLVTYTSTNFWPQTHIQHGPVGILS